MYKKELVEKIVKDRKKGYSYKEISTIKNSSGKRLPIQF